MQGSDALARCGGARGAVSLARGDASDALSALRDSLQLWLALEAPYESARGRILVGLACAELGDHDSAALELEAARCIFEELGASTDVDRVHSLMTFEVPRDPHGLSPRELQVLRLDRVRPDEPGGCGRAHPEQEDSRPACQQHLREARRLLARSGDRVRVRAAPGLKYPFRRPTSWVVSAEAPAQFPLLASVTSTRPREEAMSKAYDAIVVGARCAGSPTAMLLARKGYTSSVVDRATFPSDTISTHLIHPPGRRGAERWGLLDRVVATAVRRSTRTRSTSARSRSRARHRRRPFLCARGARCSTSCSWMPPPRRASRCVRGSPSKSLSSDDGRVAGIRGPARAASVTERARVVVGADGRHSLVARRDARAIQR